MKINRNNYEAYLLDLMEGNLSPEDQQELRDFLILNPDCALPFDLSDPWILEERKVAFSGKEKLKKIFPNPASVLTDSNFDLFSIARMEGDLSTTQEMEHEEVVINDSKKREDWTQWQQTKLLARVVEYQGKDKLKKNTGVRSRLIWLSVISTAAAVVLLFILLKKDVSLPEMEIAVESKDLAPVLEDSPSDPGMTASSVEEEAIAAVDEPVMFSIKKIPDRPVESVTKGKTKDLEQEQDSILHLEPRSVEPGPIRLASYETYSNELLRKSPYDQIKPLEIPSSDIHLVRLSLAQISEIDLQEAFDDYTEEKNISLFSIANAGIKGINKITGTDISLMASRDDEGDVSGFRLKSKRFSFSRPIEPSE